MPGCGGVVRSSESFPLSPRSGHLSGVTAHAVAQNRLRMRVNDCKCRRPIKKRLHAHGLSGQGRQPSPAATAVPWGRRSRVGARSKAPAKGRLVRSPARPEAVIKRLGARECGCTSARVRKNDYGAVGWVLRRNIHEPHPPVPMLTVTYDAL